MSSKKKAAENGSAEKKTAGQTAEPAAASEQTGQAETVEVEAPIGTLKYKILSIER